MSDRTCSSFPEKSELVLIEFETFLTIYPETRVNKILETFAVVKKLRQLPKLHYNLSYFCFSSLVSSSHIC